MKDLSFFKFSPDEYLTGDIFYCSPQAQGYFINFCCISFLKGGYVENNEMLQRRLNVRSTDDERAFNELISNKIIKQSERGLYVDFIVSQIHEYVGKISQCTEAGKVSARKRIEGKLNGTSTEINGCLTAVGKSLKNISTEVNDIEIEIEEEKEEEVKKGEAPSLSFPQNLFESELFMGTFEKWMKLRKKMKKTKGGWVSLFQEQLAWLSGFGPETATEILQNSLRNEYQGLFEPNKTSGGGKPQSKFDPRNPETWK